MWKQTSACVGLGAVLSACAAAPTYTSAAGIPNETLETCSQATSEYFAISERLATPAELLPGNTEVLATTLDEVAEPADLPSRESDLARLERITPLFEVCSTLLDREVLAQAYRSGQSYVYLSNHYSALGSRYRYGLAHYYSPGSYSWARSRGLHQPSIRGIRQTTPYNGSSSSSGSSPTTSTATPSTPSAAAATRTSNRTKTPTRTERPNTSSNRTAGAPKGETW